MTWWDWLLACAVLALIALPPRWDPAIRLSDWFEKRRR